MVLSDVEIRRLSTGYEEPSDCRDPLCQRLLEPFSEEVSDGGVVSYGLTSAGYDLRLGASAWFLKSTYEQDLVPSLCKDPEYLDRLFDRMDYPFPGVIKLHSRGYMLATSMEYIRMPRNLKGTCVGKSTFARCGIHINTTPLEPEWEGNLTIEIANHSPNTVWLRVGEGIAQLEFHLIHGRVGKSYKDKRGKYQGQHGVTPARVKE